MGAISTVVMPSGTAVAVSVPAAPPPPQPVVPAGVGAGFPKPQVDIYRVFKKSCFFGSITSL